MNLKKLLLTSLVFVTFGSVTSATVNADSWKSGTPSEFKGTWVASKHNAVDKSEAKYGKYYRTSFTISKDNFTIGNLYYGANKKYKTSQSVTGADPKYKVTNGTYYIEANYNNSKEEVFTFKKQGSGIKAKGFGTFYLSKSVPKTLNAK